MIPANMTWRSAGVKTAKLFRNGDSQAVRLPKEFRFEGSEVWIKKAGDAVVLLPKAGTLAGLLASLDKFSDDFMSDRSQPAEQKRREQL